VVLESRFADRRCGICVYALTVVEHTIGRTEVHLRARMVDRATWDTLSSDEQREFDEMHDDFVNAVHRTGIPYGTEFAEEYRVVSTDRLFRISNGVRYLPGIESRCEVVMNALFADACQNLGR
jgi:hypothetical protein